jgi:hypothetical protein
VRWNPLVFLSVFPPEIAQNEGREGVNHLMKISKIEMLAPASSSTKGN